MNKEIEVKYIISEVETVFDVDSGRDKHIISPLLHYVYATEKEARDQLMKFTSGLYTITTIHQVL